MHGYGWWQKIDVDNLEKFLYKDNYYEESLIGRKFYLDNSYEISFKDIQNCVYDENYRLKTDNYYISK